MSVIFFPRFSCCPYYREVHYSVVPTRRELTVLYNFYGSKTCLADMFLIHKSLVPCGLVPCGLSTAILRKVVGKSGRDNPERHCG